MEFKIILNDELIKNESKWLVKNFELIEEEEKLFLKYSLDKTKEIRIHLKNTLLTPEKREFIKNVWKTGDGIDDFLSSVWLTKSIKSGVLLLVPYDTEASDKSGLFVLTISKSFFFPTPLYFKRSHITGVAASFFYSKPKDIIFLLGKENLSLIYNKDNQLSIKKYIEQEKEN